MSLISWSSKLQKRDFSHWDRSRSTDRWSAHAATVRRRRYPADHWSLNQLWDEMATTEPKPGNKLLTPCCSAGRCSTSLATTWPWPEQASASTMAGQVWPRYMCRGGVCLLNVSSAYTSSACRSQMIVWEQQPGWQERGVCRACVI